jgi:hypothetical protein
MARSASRVILRICGVFKLEFTPAGRRIFKINQRGINKIPTVGFFVYYIRSKSTIRSLTYSRFGFDMRDYCREVVN